MLKQFEGGEPAILGDDGLGKLVDNVKTLDLGVELKTEALARSWQNELNRYPDCRRYQRYDYNVPNAVKRYEYSRKKPHGSRAPYRYRRLDRHFFISAPYRRFIIVHYMLRLNLFVKNNLKRFIRQEQRPSVNISELSVKELTLLV